VCHWQVIGMQARYWNGGGGPTSIRGGDDAPPPAVESGNVQCGTQYIRTASSFGQNYIFFGRAD